MLSINKTKIQTEKLRIQIFDDELFIISDNLQMNVFVKDTFIYDFHNYIILQIGTDYRFVLSFNNYQHWYFANISFESKPAMFSDVNLTNDNTDNVKIITHNFRKDDYWAIRKWFLKQYTVTDEDK